MIKTLRNAWKIPDLRKRLLFTLGMLFVFRLGAHIPVPGVNNEALKDLFSQGNLLGFFDVVAGGALKDFTIFAMSVTPYITASIVIQLLTLIIPSWERMIKEGGQEGRKKQMRYTRYATVILAFIQALAVTLGIRSYLLKQSWSSYLLIALTLAAGTAFLMWLGEKIQEHGIGNGISLIIFTGIISRLPMSVVNMIRKVRLNEMSIFTVIAIVLGVVVMIAAVILIQEGQRRIPVQYARRVVGRKVVGGQSTHIPLRINQAGVIPVIFASSILMFPATIATFSKAAWLKKVGEALQMGGWLHTILYMLFIFGFTYFYTSVQFNPRDISDNLKQQGGFVPGIRPGKPTTDYLSRVSGRLTFVGATFLCALVIIPIVISSAFNIQIGIAGTSLIIMVGVALDTVKQIENQLMMRHYGGFLK
ncbi:preprotein translocase subunit SecY [Clostridium sp. 'deep sea']|uniref:preprotein translocase subunit SecY n=1 Tax=Clostridium sp. 'deep sea' TaxID=2779445 RepID=UPI0018968546|nr:preprotein translocase subunit SecY [Clostridium sp. 'deep sea']QOR34597.1 preprotein translocase subunit SecY [Clostridium sp. 'deep sea']